AIQPRRWGTRTVSVWAANRGRQNCDGSRARDADRLLIRPASGRQADTGLSARTNHWKDIHERSHSRIESQTKSTDANLTNAPDGTAHTLTDAGMSPDGAWWADSSATAQARLWLTTSTLCPSGS